MLPAIWQFLVTVPVENSFLRGLVTVGVILMVGVILFFFWEVLPEFPKHIGQIIRRIGGFAGVRGPDVAADTKR